MRRLSLGLLLLVLLVFARRTFEKVPYIGLDLPLLFCRYLIRVVYPVVLIIRRNELLAEFPAELLNFILGEPVLESVRDRLDVRVELEGQ